jgi:hypothetical protein
MSLALLSNTVKSSCVCVRCRDSENFFLKKLIFALMKNIYFWRQLLSFSRTLMTLSFHLPHGIPKGDDLSEVGSKDQKMRGVGE